MRAVASGLVSAKRATARWISGSLSARSSISLFSHVLPIDRRGLPVHPLLVFIALYTTPHCEVTCQHHEVTCVTASQLATWLCGAPWPSSSPPRPAARPVRQQPRNPRHHHDNHP